MTFIRIALVTSAVLWAFQNCSSAVSHTSQSTSSAPQVMGGEGGDGMRFISVASCGIDSTILVTRGLQSAAIIRLHCVDLASPEPIAMSEIQLLQNNSVLEFSGQIFDLQTSSAQRTTLAYCQSSATSTAAQVWVTANSPTNLFAEVDLPNASSAPFSVQATPTGYATGDFNLSLQSYSLSYAFGTQIATAVPVTCSTQTQPVPPLCSPGTYTVTVNGDTIALVIPSVASDGSFAAITTYQETSAPTPGNCKNGSISFNDGDAYVGTYTATTMSGTFTYNNNPNYAWTAVFVSGP